MIITTPNIFVTLRLLLLIFFICLSISGCSGSHVGCGPMIIMEPKGSDTPAIEPDTPAFETDTPAIVMCAPSSDGEDIFTGVFVTTRDILLEGETENSKYGLFSYILLRKEPESDAEWSRHRAIIEAYSSCLEPTEYYENRLNMQSSALNISYLPIRKCANKLYAHNYFGEDVSFLFSDGKAYFWLELLIEEVLQNQFEDDDCSSNLITVNFMDAPSDMVLDALTMAAGCKYTRTESTVTITTNTSEREPCAVFEHDNQINYALPSVRSLPDYYVSSYDYARANMILSKLDGLTSNGPFIVASQVPLSNPRTIANSDEVFILDLSRVDDNLFSEVFIHFQSKVTNNEDIWQEGFDWEMIRILFQSALRMHGAQVLAAMDYTQGVFKLVKDASATEVK